MKVITNIKIETEVYNKEDLLDDNLYVYEDNVYGLLENNLDDNAEIDVDIVVESETGKYVWRN